MANQDHKPAVKTLDFRGLCLSKPPDLIPDGKYAVAKNIRPAGQGQIGSRQSLADLHTTALAATKVHSMRRLNQEIPGGGSSFTRFVGADDKLYIGTTSFTQVETGFSGQPLSMIPARPDSTPEPWLYIGDGNKMRKVNSAGTSYQMGISPPPFPPFLMMEEPKHKVIETFDAGSGYTVAGTAGATSALASLSTTIQGILYDSGASGWASIVVPVVADALQPGSFIRNTTTSQDAFVQEVFAPASSATITAIEYDAGSSGYCTIQPSKSMTQLKPDCVVRLNSSQYVRVLSVTEGPNGIHSFRCVTAGTVPDGAALEGAVSFRAYTPGTWGFGNGLERRVTRVSFSGSGLGTISKTTVVACDAIDDRPVTGDDYVHFSIRVDDPSRVTEGKIVLNINPGGPADFGKNALYKTFRRSDLARHVTGAVTTLQAGSQQLANQQISNAAISAVEMVAGASQWTDVHFRISEFLRIGSDQTVSLRDVTAFQIELTITGSGAMNVDVDDLFISGTYGPDIGLTGGDIFYRFRARGRTGAVSNMSPPTRSGVRPKRQRVRVRMDGHLDPQVTALEVFRSGGGIDQWVYVGTVVNASVADYLDDKFTPDLASSTLAEFDNFQPFPTIDTPKAGVCDVVGTRVIRSSGDVFDPNWAPGTAIIIDGTTYTLFQSPGSNQALDLAETVGYRASVGFEIPAAVKQAQPLPSIWGPIGAGTHGEFIFGCGDPYQPGILYWTNGNDPDSASDVNYLELTSPSEALQVGGIFNGRGFVFSTRRLFQIVPSLSGNAKQFYAQEVPNGKGIVSRYALAVGPRVWFVAQDGVYETSLGDLKCITNEDLEPLFPRAGVPTREVHGLKPIDLTSNIDEIRLAYYDGFLYLTSNIDEIRLAYYDGFLYLTYVDTAGARCCLVYDTTREAWMVDEYNRNGTALNPVAFYGEDGGTAQQLDLLTNNNRVLYFEPAGTEQFECAVRAGFVDMGDSRSKKRFSDMTAEANPAGATITLTPYIDNGAIGLSAATMTGSIQDTKLIELGSPAGTGQLAQNIGLDMRWQSTASTRATLLYEWQVSLITLPADTGKRATDWTDDGFLGTKYMQGILIDADTGNLQRTILVEYLDDAGALQTGATLTIQHNGPTEKPYSFSVPFFCREVRLRPTDANIWRLNGWRWIWTKKTEKFSLVEDVTEDGYPGPKFIQGVVIEADTQGSPVSVNVLVDGAVISTLSVNHVDQRSVGYALPQVTGTTLKLVPLAPWRFYKANWVWTKKPHNWALANDWDDGGNFGAKYYQGVLIEADTGGSPVLVDVYKDGSASIYQTLTVNHNGQISIPYNLTPFIGHSARLVPRTALKTFRYKWIAEARPEFYTQRTEWTDEGYMGAKFIQGVIIEADTGGAARTVTLEVDGVATDRVLTVNHNGQVTREYAFDQPIIGHTMRLVPNGDWRMFRVKYVWEPAPELATVWQTQETTHDLPGWHHVREGFISYMSSGDVTLSLSCNGLSVDYILPASAGTYNRHYIPFQSNKGKWYLWRLTAAAGLRLFKRDCEIRCRAWGDPGGYALRNPFGGQSRASGAEI